MYAVRTLKMSNFVTFFHGTRHIEQRMMKLNQNKWLSPCSLQVDSRVMGHPESTAPWS